MTTPPLTARPFRFVNGFAERTAVPGLGIEVDAAAWSARSPVAQPGLAAPGRLLRRMVAAVHLPARWLRMAVPARS
jgi:hypothetical protein